MAKKELQPTIDILLIQSPAIRLIEVEELRIGTEKVKIRDQRKLISDFSKPIASNHQNKSLKTRNEISIKLRSSLNIVIKSITSPHRLVFQVITMSPQTLLPVALHRTLIHH